MKGSENLLVFLPLMKGSAIAVAFVRGQNNMQQKEYNLSILLPLINVNAISTGSIVPLLGEGRNSAIAVAFMQNNMQQKGTTFLFILTLINVNALAPAVMFPF
ncbi:hypothetical protein ACFQZI_17925 [Mucilaginibacter lutimaris]|uniref:Uncharacterized protein n=1 Tax=Mucilaginibacter lutimaris TaxID=931629 RepID=A0ABW2ZKP3_9SPHI